MKTFNPEGMIKKHSFPYYPNHFIQQIVRECSAGYQEKYRDCRWDKRFENVRIRGWIGHNGEQCCDCGHIWRWRRQWLDVAAQDGYARSRRG